uniref:Uncharacterized protein n=1 Tax=Oryza sativa subsp. japonica TaxID=39947 RepID=Q7XHK8_ORYSJ|nr:hypothetical protein [Oryza sativa Japonica Group]BAD30116.1 hypothetical protein [Oryza sativa Japonica Group]
MGRRPILSFPSPSSLLGRPQAEAQPGRPAALLSEVADRWGPPVGSFPHLPPLSLAPPRPQPPPRPRLRLLRATSTTPARSPPGRAVATVGFAWPRSTPSTPPSSRFVAGALVPSHSVPRRRFKLRAVAFGRRRRLPCRRTPPSSAACRRR